MLELVVSLHHEKFAICKPGRGPSPDPGPASALTVDIPFSRVMRNGLHSCHSVSGGLLWQPELRLCVFIHVSFFALELSEDTFFNSLHICLPVYMKLHVNKKETFPVSPLLPKGFCHCIIVQPLLTNTQAAEKRTGSTIFVLILPKADEHSSSS